LESLSAYQPALEERQTYYLDTDSHSLHAHDVILRLRLEEDGEVSSTVKIRPIEMSQVRAEFLRAKGFRCEFDENIFGKPALACSFKQKFNGSHVGDLLRSGADLWSLFSTEQIRFLESVRPAVSHNVPIRHFGPAHCRRWEFWVPSLERSLVVEAWEASERVLVELSARTLLADAKNLRSQFFAFLSEHRVRFSRVQMSKTEFVLSRAPAQAH
jgi:hypothetical protein